MRYEPNGLMLGRWKAAADLVDYAVLISGLVRRATPWSVRLPHDPFTATQVRLRVLAGALERL